MKKGQKNKESWMETNSQNILSAHLLYIIHGKKLYNLPLFLLGYKCRWWELSFVKNIIHYERHRIPQHDMLLFFLSIFFSNITYWILWRLIRQQKYNISQKEGDGWGGWADKACVEIGKRGRMVWRRKKKVKLGVISYICGNTF